MWLVSSKPIEQADLAFTAWIISVPLIAGLTYYATRPALRRLATALARRS
jgi:hypothetical protein